MFKTFFGFFELGGPVVFILFLVSVLLFFLIISRINFFYFIVNEEKNKVKSTIASLPGDKHEKSLKKLALCEYDEKLNDGFQLINILIIICPVLGLLGTVTGMIQVFDVVAVLGTGNARALASGITMATLPTMVGMTISIIGLLVMAYLRNLSIKHRIDQ